MRASSAALLVLVQMLIAFDSLLQMPSDTARELARQRILARVLQYVTRHDVTRDKVVPHGRGCFLLVDTPHTNVSGYYLLGFMGTLMFPYGYRFGYYCVSQNIYNPTWRGLVARIPQRYRYSRPYPCDSDS